MDASCFISLGIINTKHSEACLNDSATHGQAWQRFSLTATGELRLPSWGDAALSPLCVDSNATGLLRRCDGQSSQRWVATANRTLRHQGTGDASLDGVCLAGNHYAPTVSVAACVGSPNRTRAANARSNEIWSVQDDRVRAGSTDSFLVATGQCLAATEVLIESTSLHTTDGAGKRWYFSFGDPGIAEPHDEPSPGGGFHVTHDPGAVYDGQP